MPIGFVCQDTVDLLLVERLATVVIKKLIRTSLLSKHFESVNSWEISERAVLGVKVWVRLQKYVCKGCTKICTINVKMLLSRNIHFLAFRAVGFYSRCGKLFRKSYRKDKLTITQNTLAIPKSSKSVLFTHHSQSSWRKNKSSVSESVQVHCRLINFQKPSIIHLTTKRLTLNRLSLQSRDFLYSISFSSPHLTSQLETHLLEPGYFFLQSVQIKRVPEVLGINLKLNKKLPLLTSTKNSCPSRSQNQEIQPPSLLLSESNILTY